MNKAIQMWLKSEDKMLLFNVEKRGLYLSDGCALVQVLPTDLPDGTVPQVGHKMVRQGRRDDFGDERPIVHPLTRYLPETLPTTVVRLEITDWSFRAEGCIPSRMLQSDTGMQIYVDEKYFDLIMPNIPQEWYGSAPNEPIFVLDKLSKSILATIMPVDVKEKKITHWPNKPVVAVRAKDTLAE